jgi:hypothetical protein
MHECASAPPDCTCMQTAEPCFGIADVKRSPDWRVSPGEKSALNLVGNLHIDFVASQWLLAACKSSVLAYR